MRFLSLQLERYGAFTDRVLALREDASLHVVLGPNEAGKTSALNAIGDLLFGFPKRERFDFLHEKSTLRIGARLRFADGHALLLRRRRGDRNTLLDEHDKPLADDLLAPLLGGVKRETFDGEFGLTAQALREGGRDLLQAGGRLADTLAAASSSLATLSHLRAKLGAEADDLFSARRVASKPFYLAYDRCQAAEKSLREKIVTADALGQAEVVVQQARERREALSAAHDESGRELARCERALRTRDKLRRLEYLRGEQDQLVDFPAIESKTLAQWRAALNEAARIDEALSDHRADEEAAAQAIAALDIDQRLLDLGARIDELREAIGAVRQAERDLPGRRAEAREARESLDKAAQRLGLAGHEALLASQPTDAALALVEDLIDRFGRAERRHAEAAEALELARHDAQAFSDAATRQGHSSDPAPFKTRLELLADIPADADRLRRDELAQALASRRLEEEVEQLDPFPAALDALARLALPDASSIEAARRLFDAYEAEDKRAAVETSGLQSALTAVEQEIVSLQREGEVKTLDDLDSSRAARDRAYERLGASLDGEALIRRQAFDAVGAANRRIDATTDLLLTGADRAARFAAACERRAKLQREYENLRALQDERVARWHKAQAEWRELWARSAVAPKTPEKMAGWRARVSDILQRRERLHDSRLETEALARKLEGQRDGVTRLIDEMDGSGDPSLPIESAYKFARATLERLQANWAEAGKVVALRDNALDRLERAERTHAKARAELERLSLEWPTALAAVGLNGPMKPVEAKAALAVWRNAPLFQEKLKTAQHRIDTMEGNIAGFDGDVAALIEAAAPDLANHGRRAALETLSERLSQMRSRREKREALREAAEKREAARAKLAQRLESANTTLAAARATLSLAPEMELGAALERVERQNACAAELDAGLRDLSESADGFDEAALRAEQSDLDYDGLPGAIERLRIDSRQVLQDLQEAAKAEHDAKRARDALAQGQGAAGAARERSEAQAELLSVATRWLRRAAAARLAALAIERHRAAVEDPLLKRASKLFAIATDGAFSGLGADYDADDRPTLVGLRASGAKVAVAGLSEGARDQLFLSLRLALLELRSGEPLPFIGDDLLASFDDSRTARALELLSEFGKARQAIVFTHHRHVAEIAARLAGVNVDVVEL
jgi:chromosome segregation protein